MEDWNFLQVPGCVVTPDNWGEGGGELDARRFGEGLWGGGGGVGRRAKTIQNGLDTDQVIGAKAIAEYACNKQVLECYILEFNVGTCLYGNIL